MDSLESVKKEIAFFMDKSFQFSFVYIGAVFAALASANIGNVTKLFGIPDLVLFIIPALLLLNFLYLVVAVSCLFAILKRGYFILSNGGHSQTDFIWEIFVRSGSEDEAEQFGMISWNIDNYYTVVICFLITLLSVFLAIYGVLKFRGYGYWKILPIALLLLHALPLWAFVRTGKLNAKCRKLGNQSFLRFTSLDPGTRSSFRQLSTPLRCLRSGDGDKDSPYCSTRNQLPSGANWVVNGASSLVVLPRSF